MPKLAPTCGALTRPALLALLVCLAGSVYLTLQLELPTDSDPQHERYGVAAASLFPHRGAHHDWRTGCRHSSDKASCVAELDEGGSLESELSTGGLPHQVDGIAAENGVGVGSKRGAGRRWWEAGGAETVRRRLVEPAARESAGGSTTGLHQKRAQADGAGTDPGPRARPDTAGSHESGDSSKGVSFSSSKHDKKVEEGQNDAFREASEHAASDRIWRMQAQVQQCIVQRGGGLRAVAVPGDPCRLRIMHPPGVAVTWSDSAGLQHDAREVEVDVCQVARYWAALRNSSLLLTKEYLDAHDATPAVMHRMRRHKSDTDPWCRPKRCLHILRSQLPDRPPLRPAHFPRCAVVGNAADLLRTRLGAEIDGHDAVFRMNGAPTANFTAHVGAKTTFRVVNNRAWAMGLGAVSESAREVLVAHGLFHPGIFRELRFGLPPKPNGTTAGAQRGAAARHGAMEGDDKEHGQNGSSPDGQRESGFSGPAWDQAFGEHDLSWKSTATERGHVGDRDRLREAIGRADADERGEWSKPLANPVLFMDNPAAGAAAAEGTGFRALQLAASVCGHVALYGFSCDVGYARWGKYFTPRDGPGHAPLRGVMYYQLLECLGVVSLHSSARAARTPANPSRQKLADVLAAVADASPSPAPACTQWAAAFTPHFRGRNACNSPIALPLKAAAMRAARFDAPAGLHMDANLGGLARVPREGESAAAARAASMHEAPQQRPPGVTEMVPARNERPAEEGGPGQPLLVTRYLEHFNWTHHVCVVRFPTDSSSGALNEGGRGAAPQSDLWADHRQARGLDGRLRTGRGNHVNATVEVGPPAPTDWLTSYRPNLC